MEHNLKNKPDPNNKIPWEEIELHIPQKEFNNYNGNIQKIYNEYSKSIEGIQIDDEMERALEAGSKEEAVDLIIISALIEIGTIYIGKKTIREETLQACSSYVREFFSHLSVAELILAFKLASIEDVIVVNTTLYNYDFNVTFLGKILTCYGKYRVKIIKVIRQAMRSISESDQIDETEKNQKNKIAREERVNKIIQFYKIFYEENHFKTEGGVYELLEKIGFDLPIVVVKKENYYREKITRILSEEETPKGISAFDQAVKKYFSRMKDSKITPQQFETDIQQKLQIYEDELLNPNKN